MTSNYERIAIWQDTYRHFQDTKPMTRKTNKYIDVSPNFLKPTYQQTLVRLINTNAIETALEFKNGGYKVALIHAADPIKMGGQIDRGIDGEEEAIYRRSNYFQHQKKQFYPLKDKMIIYSREVSFIKGVEREEGAQYLSQPVNIDVIACPIIKMPRISYDRSHYLREEDRKLMESRVRLVFETANLNKVNICIVTDLGQPAKDLGLICKKMVREFDGFFKAIIFTVHDNNFQNFSTAF